MVSRGNDQIDTADLVRKDVTQRGLPLNQTDNKACQLTVLGSKVQTIAEESWLVRAVTSSRQAKMYLFTHLAAVGRMNGLVDKGSRLARTR